MTAHVKKVDALISAIVKEVDEDIWNDIYGKHPEFRAAAKEQKTKLRLIALEHLSKFLK